MFNPRCKCQQKRKKRNIKLNTWLAVSSNMLRFFPLGFIKSKLTCQIEVILSHIFCHISFILFSLFVISFLAIFYFSFQRILLSQQWSCTVCILTLSCKSPLGVPAARTPSGLLQLSVYINIELQEPTRSSCSWIIKAS